MFVFVMFDLVNGNLIFQNVCQGVQLLIWVVLFRFLGIWWKKFLVSQMVKGMLIVVQMRIILNWVLMMFRCDQMMNNGRDRVIFGMVWDSISYKNVVFFLGKVQWVNVQLLVILISIVIKVEVIEIIREFWKQLIIGILIMFLLQLNIVWKLFRVRFCGIQIVGLVRILLLVWNVDRMIQSLGR